MNRQSNVLCQSGICKVGLKCGNRISDYKACAIKSFSTADRGKGVQAAIDIHLVCMQ